MTTCGTKWGKRSRETICGAELSGMRNASLRRFIVKNTGEHGLEVASVRFPYDIHSPLLRSNVTHEVTRVPALYAPHYDHFNSPSCALVSHSRRTLPGHIWFLVRLIMSNNVCSIPLGPHSYVLDITPGHECLEERKEETIVHGGFKTEGG